MYIPLIINVRATTSLFYLTINKYFKSRIIETVQDSFHVNLNEKKKKWIEAKV